ncbi:MAG TPA: copper resistance CopC family protein [Candidatus Binataceae bacterium]|jgi:copper resistance protein C|nr:copper resistance CopC family protein [Candidatus Binataceae bacterium]
MRRKLLRFDRSLLPFTMGAMLMVIATGGGPDASAHSFPEEEHPSAGQTIVTTPEVTIKFDAPIEKLFAKLEVLDAQGNNVVVGTPVISSDGIMLTVKLAALKPGDYTVKWGVVCVDTHHTEGSYMFTVAGGSS